MRAPKKQIAARKAAKLRSWRATVLRQRGEYLGTVEAPDAKAAEALAVSYLGWKVSAASGSWSARRSSAVNIMDFWTKLTPQEESDLVFALKYFEPEKYRNFSFSELPLVDLDDVRAALGTWGPRALASKLAKLESNPAPKE
jgi:hypothetical protein